MACASCGTKSANGEPSGCGSKGHCASGGCNRMSTFDWLTIQGVRDVADQHYVEVSFNHGARKEFFYAPPEAGVTTGDTVVVESEHGTDTGYITLSGDLTLDQMVRRNTKASRVQYDVVRKAHGKDLDRLDEARRLERDTLKRARVLAYGTELPLKLSDVEYQGDLRKATFYYTSEHRIDFRELIKSLAREFRVKVEMRQIGARQEAARLGGIGSCGRELCCSTWLTDFKSVNTAAARYQGLALNQTKLSGQCGRLKCCLNYELDTYLDALQDFPEKADKIRLPSGKAILVKTDVFKGLMHYQIMRGRVRGPFVTMTVAQVHEVLANPTADIETFVAIEHQRQQKIAIETADEHDYDDVTGVADVPLEKRRRKKRSRSKDDKRGGGSQGGARKRSGGSAKAAKSDNSPNAKGEGDGVGTKKGPRRNKRRRSGKGRGNEGGNKPSGGEAS